MITALFAKLTCRGFHTYAIDACLGSGISLTQNHLKTI